MEIGVQRQVWNANINFGDTRAQYGYVGVIQYFFLYKQILRSQR